MYAQQQAAGGEQFTDATAAAPTGDHGAAGGRPADEDVVEAEIVDESR